MKKIPTLFERIYINHRLPEAMRGECCQYWDLFRRCGEEVDHEAKKL